MRVRSMLATAAVAATALVVAAAPAFAADSSTAAVQTNAQAPVIPTLVAVRTAHHPGFDRITFEFSGPRRGHQRDLPGRQRPRRPGPADRLAATVRAGTALAQGSRPDRRLRGRGHLWP